MTRTTTPVVLAADVGGTNTRVGLFRCDGGSVGAEHTSEVPSRSGDTLEEILRACLRDAGDPGLASACVAIAGPVVDDAVEVTNLPWRVEASSLAKALALPRVHLLNDLQATALGMLELPDDAFAVLQAGTREPGAGHVAVVAAGTGFGEAALVWDGERHHPAATEAGHTSYAPRDEEDVARWRWLGERHGHVSLERVVSGPGLAETYAWLRAVSRVPEPALLRERIAAGDPAAAIAEAGLRSEDALCAAAVARFAGDYGAAAGDAALRHLALGGVILAGGIAPKLLPALQKPEFLAAFRAKGRFDSLLTSLRVSVCTAPNPALQGAARLAARSRPEAV
jgi:glucokinase